MELGQGIVKPISSYLLPNYRKYKSRLLTDITSVLQIIIKISVGQTGRAHNILNIYSHRNISETTEISSIQ